MADKKIYEEQIDWVKQLSIRLQFQARDTTSERIKGNRMALETLYRFIPQVESIIPGLPLEYQMLVQDTCDLFNDYYHYFDRGYKSSHRIDNLSDQIINKLSEIIELMEG